MIEDPWLSIPCAPRRGGCEVAFDDPEFSASRRDTLYYVRAIEEPSLAVRGQNLGCTYDEGGSCVAVEPCGTDRPEDDDCLGDVEERAWSSPIFVDHSRAKWSVEGPSEVARVGRMNE